MMKSSKKIIHYEQLVAIVPYLHGKKTVVVGGCFDIVHYGHYEFLRRSAALGEHLTILLEPDEFIRKKKKREPIHTQRERAEILAGFHFTGTVILLPLFIRDEEYEKIIQKLKPSIVAITKGDPETNGKKAQIQSVGGKLQIVCEVIGSISTSNILKEHASFLSH